ncbi:nucleotide exchange factor GrpE [Synoicihabitans lomoniglobus]|uniref:Protein GrpE n=1 Tax=Synoicihabitans lomoniglobus TaxID=2909285 RepID=A0AAE9ZWV1_9BACT|nr:nucleotide exchange factor GrpE [Opitutaceae bacterium LMO-M01]WED63983.1 nucleotide exchange factor GrpE [Opitutaceae bacterium LMO-M01]
MNDTASKTDPTDSEETAAQAAAAPETAPEEATAAEPVEASVEVEPTPEELLEKARQETAAAKESHLRAVADLENFRRRTAREKDDLRAFAAANVVEELMPVLDNLGFALTAAKAPNAELKSLVEGVDMVATQFKTALGNHGLKEINPVDGDFDPNHHEALSQQPSDDVAEGKVLQVIRVGYMLNSRLLRPASVIVSGGPAAAAADDAGEAKEES